MVICGKWRSIQACHRSASKDSLDDVRDGMAPPNAKVDATTMAMMQLRRQASQRQRSVDVPILPASTLQAANILLLHEQYQK